MTLGYSSQFKKQYKKLSEKIKIQTKTRINILIEDEFSPILKNHKLHGEFSKYRSINITGDIRVVYRKTTNGFYFFAIGSHSKLYS